MARPIELDTPGAKKSGRTFLIPTANIVVPKVNPSRAFAPSKVEIEELMQDIARSGQSQPIKVTRIKDSTDVRLVFGFTRLLAIQMLEEETGSPMPVRCEVHDYRATRDEILANASENHHRAGLTAVDYAQMITNLEAEGMTRTEIAGFLHKSKGWVTDTVKLLALDAKTRKLIAVGDLASTTGVEIAKEPDTDKRAAMVTEALKLRASGKKGGDTRRTAQARRARQASSDEADTHRRKRTSKQAHLFFSEDLAEDGTAESPGSLVGLGRVLAKYMEGYYDEAAMKRKLRAIVEGK